MTVLSVVALGIYVALVCAVVLGAPPLVRLHNYLFLTRKEREHDHLPR